MYSSTFGIHGTISTVLAALIVGTSGLALDRGHPDPLRTGVIEIGELTAIDALPRVATLLPEVVVSASRLENLARAEA